MSLAHDILPQTATFAPEESFEEFLKRVPARYAVYLLADAEGRPIQLLCVKNLRASLKRRLGGEETITLSRRVNYRDIVRHIAYRRVDSRFEADLIYLDAARAFFPETYRGLTSTRQTWFVHVNPATKFPRYTRTQDPSGLTGEYFGPLEDKHVAQKLVHTMEAMFDLCRDYSILIQSPNGGPCAWKQMDKCAGPCDATISLEAYRALVAQSAAVLADPRREMHAQTARMNGAAADLQFELAEKIKANIAALEALTKGNYRHLRPLRDFAFLSLQQGPRAGTAKVFLITLASIAEVAGLIAEPTAATGLLRDVLERAEHAIASPLDEADVERIALVAAHLFTAKHRHGVFVRLEALDDRSLVKAFRELEKQSISHDADDASEVEGVQSELQSI